MTIGCMFFSGFEMGDMSDWYVVSGGGCTVQDDVVHSGLYAGKLEGYADTFFHANDGTGIGGAVLSATPYARTHFIVDALPSIDLPLASWQAYGAAFLESDGHIRLQLTDAIGVNVISTFVVTPGVGFRLDFRAWPAAFSADGTGVTTLTNDTLEDARQNWVTNEHVGATVTSNGQTLTVTSNTPTILTGTAHWSADPGDGQAYSIAHTNYSNWQVRINVGEASEETLSLVDTLSYWTLGSYFRLGTSIALWQWNTDAANCYCDDVYICDDGWPPEGQCSKVNYPTDDSATDVGWVKFLAPADANISVTHPEPFGAGTGTLHHHGKTWATDEWVGDTVSYYTTAYTVYTTLVVTSNTADVLTGTGGWSADPGADGLTYTITGPHKHLRVDDNPSGVLEALNDADYASCPPTGAKYQTFFHSGNGGYAVADTPDLHAVVYWGRMRASGATVLYYRRMRQGATVLNSSGLASDTTANWTYPIFRTLDLDGAAWTEHNITNHLEIGAWARSYTTGQDAQLLSCVLLVDFAPTGTWTGISLGVTAKISGVAWASVAKVSGVAEASISKVSGVQAN